MTATLAPRHAPARSDAATTCPTSPRGVPWLVGSELLSGGLGFLVTIHWARTLGRSEFADVEFATAVAAWLLVIVRGGVEIIAYREAARRPRLTHELTRLTLGLKCAGALAGYTLILLLAASAGPSRRAAVAVAGLVLLPSALVPDVGLRASGRLGGIALAQVVRALVYTVVGLRLVSRPDHAVTAALCATIAEACAWLVLLAVHARQYGFPWPRFRRRAWRTLARKGTVASLIRFGRVSLYCADLLVLGWCGNTALGEYAAARRVGFALVALGLVWPAAVSPAIARAWRDGPDRARAALAGFGSTLWALSLPAALGMSLTAPRWMALLFGSRYAGGAAWLVLIAARLPWLLSASFLQSALIACRREAEALRLVLSTCLLAALVLPASALLAGPWGVGLGGIVIEVSGTLGGWLVFSKLGLGPVWTARQTRMVMGCALMIMVCLLTWRAPIGLVCASGAAAYGACWLPGRRRPAGLARGEARS